MPRLTTERHGLSARSRGDGWGDWLPARARRAEPPGPSPGLLLAGLVVVGLGALAWYYIGPDVIRYQKIRNM